MCFQVMERKAGEKKEEKIKEEKSGEETGGGIKGKAWCEFGDKKRMNEQYSYQ